MYWLGVCHGRFYLQGLPRAARNERESIRVERELQNEKFLPTVGSEPGTFHLRSERATTALRGLMSVSGLKFTGFNLSVLFSEIHL